MDELERSVQAAAGQQSRWASVGVVKPGRENADSAVESRTKWSKIYRLFGASGESQQDEVFGAVNYYFLLNGCSPHGKYSKQIQTATGAAIEAGEVVKITGRLEGEIRQFLRGRLADSYSFLKYNPAIKEDEELATMSENVGVSRSSCWMLADWLGKDCPHFVGDEATVYNHLRTSKIAAARAKAVSALPEVDRVGLVTPETKMSITNGGGVGYHGGSNDSALF